MKNFLSLLTVQIWNSLLACKQTLFYFSFRSCQKYRRALGLYFITRARRTLKRK